MPTVGGVVAVTSSEEDGRTNTDVVFADLDDGRVLHRLEIPGWGVRANFSPEGRCYAYGAFDGTVGVIDVASGERSGSGAPLHQGPTHWVTFSPDGKTLASIGFDGQMVLLDAATATPWARAQPGPPNLRGMMAYDEDGHTVIIAYEDGSVVTFDTDPAAWEAHACTVAGRNLTAGVTRRLGESLSEDLPRPLIPGSGAGERRAAHCTEVGADLGHRVEERRQQSLLDLGDRRPAGVDRHVDRRDHAVALGAHRRGDGAQTLFEFLIDHA